MDSETQTNLKRFWNWIKTPTGLIISGLVSLIAIITFVYLLIDRYKSDKEKFEEQETIQGDLKPPPITSTPVYKATTTETNKTFYLKVPPQYKVDTTNHLPKVIGVRIAGLTDSSEVLINWGKAFIRFTPDDFYKGIDFIKTVKLDTVSGIHLDLGIKDGRLYISTEFKRLDKEETMGEIFFNHWTLYKQNILRYKYNDTMLEVKDKQSKIAFSLKYGSIPLVEVKGQMPSRLIRLSNLGHPSLALPKKDLGGSIYLQGYFIGDSSIVILNGKNQNSPFIEISKTKPNWKQEAAIEISKLKTIF